MVPYHADVVMPRWPIANWVLIGLCVLGYSLSWGAHGFTGEGQLLSREHFSVLQLVSHQFLHANIKHLVGNMIFLWVFGNAVNARLGHLLYVPAFLISGIVAGLVWLLLGSGGSLIGASGAIMGIVGLFAIYYPRNEVRVFYMILWRPGTFTISAIWLILIYFALDMLGTVLGRGGGVAYVAHIGGALFGAAVGWLLIARRLVPSDEDEENLLQVFGVVPRPEKDWRF